MPQSCRAPKPHSRERAPVLSLHCLSGWEESDVGTPHGLGNLDLTHANLHGFLGVMADSTEWQLC